MNMMSITTFVVSCALLVLTFKGALGLTGSIAMAVVLSSLAVAQWGAARQGMLAALDNGSRATTRLAKFALLMAVYLLAAFITVPLIAGELYGLLGASDGQTRRFDEEQARLRSRARDLAVAYGSLGTTLMDFQEHAARMNEIEIKTGGSCLSTRGHGVGEIQRFRQAEERRASALLAQARAPLDAAAQAAKTIDGLKIDAAKPVPEVSRLMGGHVDELNRLRNSPILAQLRDFVSSADKAGTEILIPKAQGGPPDLFACVDSARTQMLRAVLTGAQRIESLAALEPVVLLDASDAREIAKSSLVRGWSGLLEFVGFDKAKLIEPAMAKRYGLGKEYTLNGNRINFIMAWSMEVALLVLIGLALAARQKNGQPKDDQFGAKVAQALSRRALEAVSTQPNRLGRGAAAFKDALAQAKGADEIEVLSSPPPNFETQWAVRLALLSKYLVPQTGKSLLVIPMLDRAAIRAVHEAVLARLATVWAEGLSTADIRANPMLARGWTAMTGSDLHESMSFGVYEVKNPQLHRLLLTC